MDDPTSPYAGRCRRAITFGDMATRCRLDADHIGQNHAGGGLAEYPYQTIEWLDNDRRQFTSDRPDTHAWQLPPAPAPAGKRRWWRR